MHDIIDHGPENGILGHRQRQIPHVDLVLQSTHLLGRGHGADAVLHSCNHVTLVGVVRHEANRKAVSIRNPQLNHRLGIGEPLRKDADDRVGIGIQTNLFPDDGSISAEPSLKQAPRQQHDLVGSGSIFLWSKCPAKGGLNTQQGKQVPGAGGGGHHFRRIRVFSSQVATPPAPRGHIRKAMRLLAPIIEVPGRHHVVRIIAFAKVLIDHHQLVRVTKRQRLQEHRPDDGK